MSTEPDPLVLRDDVDGVTTLTLNRPEKLNALNVALFQALRQHLEALARDETVRCVVVTGAGRSFCAGHDLAGITSGERAPTRHFEPETIDLLEALVVPTVAKIRGHCFTGGLELALACDLMISSDTTKFGDTHGQWGLAPIWGMSIRLPERVGVARAKELMFTSRRIDAEYALSIGLVDAVHTDVLLDTAVAALATEIVINSAGTNRIVKQLLAARTTMSRQDSLQFERSMPFGMPSDAAERLANGGRSGSSEKKSP